MRDDSVIAIDIAKEVFQVCKMTRDRRVKYNKQLSRKELTEFMLNQSCEEIAIEACYSSHYWARVFKSQGHKVKLIPAQHVKPFVRGNKSDYNDAMAIAEASYRPDLKSVPIKSIDQQDTQFLHRVRENLVKSRISLMNQVRGLLSDYGLVTRRGHKAFCLKMVEWMSPECAVLSAHIKEELMRIYERYQTYTKDINALNTKLNRIAQTNPLCKLLLSIPGIGYINATSIYAGIGNGSQFKSAREFAVWLGLTPIQSSSGNRFTSGGITKRGDRYIRKQLVHGARAAASRCKNKTDRLSKWVMALIERRGKPKAYVALAAKMAKIAWVLIHKNEEYKTFA